MGRYRTIPVKAPTFRRLKELRRELEDRYDRAVSWDEVINYLLDGVITLEPSKVISLEAHNVMRGGSSAWLERPAPEVKVGLAAEPLGDDEPLERAGDTGRPGVQIPHRPTMPDLPSFFRDNPWLEILAQRGEDYGY